MKQRSRFLAGPLMAGAVALGLSVPAQADTGSGSSGGGNPSQQAPVSDQKLEQFAAAYTDIRSVRAEYVPKLQQAQDEQEKAKLREEGTQAMVQAVRASGLEVSEYQRIGRRLNNDPQMQERLMQIMREQQGSGQGPQGSGEGQGSTQEGQQGSGQGQGSGQQ